MDSAHGCIGTQHIGGRGQTQDPSFPICGRVGRVNGDVDGSGSPPVVMKVKRHLHHGADMRLRPFLKSADMTGVATPSSPQHMISAGALIRKLLMDVCSWTTHADAYVYVYLIANVMAACVQIKTPFLCSLFRSVISQINRQAFVGERGDCASPLLNSDNQSFVSSLWVNSR